MSWEYLEMMVGIDQVQGMADPGAADRQKNNRSLESSPIPNSSGRSWQSTVREMNHFGEHDWELVGILPVESSDSFRLFFKRHQ